MNATPLLWEAAVPLKIFLTLSECPARWKHFDLYLVADGQTAFYAGQSQCAFTRVWEHIRGGVKGHDMLGRFILVNWPKSGRFTVALFSSRGPRFAHTAVETPSPDAALLAAEDALIEEWSPCFNVSHNRQPTPLPEEYLPPTAPVKWMRSYKRMLREAAYVPRALPDDEIWER